MNCFVALFAAAAVIISSLHRSRDSVSRGRSLINSYFKPRQQQQPQQATSQQQAAAQHIYQCSSSIPAATGLGDLNLLARRTSSSWCSTKREHASKLKTI